MDAKSDVEQRLNAPAINDENVVVQCPSCQMKLRHYEVAQHCEQEMECLRQMQMQTVANVAAGSQTISESNDQSTEQRRKPWTVFQRVQRNRQLRLKQRVRKRPAPPTGHICPVCNVSFAQDKIQRHAEQCLRRSNTNGSTNERDDGSSNEEADTDEYEEYEWAGQKRIRASSMLQGGYASIGVGQTINQHQQEDEEEEDLNVDEDDTQIYGPAQYGEGDVIPPADESNVSDEDTNVTNYMRRLITGNSNINALVDNDKTRMCNHENKPLTDPATNTCIPNAQPSTLQPHGSTTSSKTAQHFQQIIEALKCKLRQYEDHVQSKFKCLICLDEYRNPAISVSCWHIHCEECWLRSLGARKLCPQCNLITTPKDLRRIYM